jgi:hypothetical protein
VRRCPRKSGTIGYSHCSHQPGENIATHTPRKLLSGQYVSSIASRGNLEYVDSIAEYGAAATDGLTIGEYEDLLYPSDP